MMEGQRQEPRVKKKRIIVCCDGTWLDSTGGLMKNKLPIPSNITRISQAIKPTSSDGVQQVVFYQAGIGSTGNFINKIVGGATAEGLSENIRSAYTFIALNYSTGDEIYLFGFSRGAFTARSIAGLIDGVGLLTKQGLEYLAEVFKDFENRENPNYKPAYPNTPIFEKPSALDPRYRNELVRKGLSRLSIAIKAIGVFDTVGSLGIPRIEWLERLHLQTKSTKEYLFYDTALNDHIENAFQALALDEHRAAFSPAVWEKPRGNETNLRQVWFSGVHSNIGGGYADQGQANITLAWMMSQVAGFIDFDEHYILDQYDETLQHYEETEQTPRPWSFGKIYRSFTGFYMLAGRTTRTPGAYTRVNPDTGRSTGKPLRQTNQYIHPSVRSRIKLKGPGVEDIEAYDGHPLDPYKLKMTDEPAGGSPIVLWQPRNRRKGSRLKDLPESPLWRIELQLLEESPRIQEYILKGSPRRGAEQASVGS